MALHFKYLIFIRFSIIFIKVDIQANKGSLVTRGVVGVFKGMTSVAGFVSRID